MNRPENSLSLDAVICRRCNTLSRAEDDTCPFCGADRQGAIFTSRADAATYAANDDHVTPPGQLDVMDLRDSNWFKRRLRRKMVTSYPTMAEPGDAPPPPPRKPARTGIAMLVGGVVAGLAAGAYFYIDSDDESDSSDVPAAFSAPGSIHNGAVDTTSSGDARPGLMTPPLAFGSSAVAKGNAPRAGQAPAQTVDTKGGVAPPPTTAKPAVTDVTTAARPATETAPIAPVAPREELALPASRVVMASGPVIAGIATPTNLPALAALAKPALGDAASATVGIATNTESMTLGAAASASVTAVAPSPELATPATPTPTPTPTDKIAAETPPVAAQTSAPASKPGAVTPQAATRAERSGAQATQAPPRKDEHAATATASIEKPAARPRQPVKESVSPSVAHNIAAVQQSLANRDLTAARRQMRGLNESQSRSPEIQRLAADLSRQERARDSAIASARACAASKDSACALRSARRAAALDPHNPQAQAVLRHALAVQNQSNTEYFQHASVIPKPVVPAMTFDGRWSAGTRHTAASSAAQENASHITFFGWGVPTVSKGRGDAH